MFKGVRKFERFLGLLNRNGSSLENADDLL